MDAQEPTEPPTESEAVETPPIDREKLAEHVRVLRAQADAAVEAEDLEFKTWLDEVRRRADIEIAAWQALPCRGEMVHVTDCTEAFAATCPRRDHGMCARHQLRRAGEEAELERQRKRAAFAAAGLPEGVLREVFDAEPLETPALLKLRSALAQRAVIVVLSGKVGCGKTCAAVRAAVEHGGTFVQAETLAQLSAFDDRLKRLEGVKFLVLDDLGVEYLDKNGYLAATLDGLLDARYAALRPTVITTNLSAGDFKARYGERITDRIRGGGQFVAIGGSSMRRKS